MIALATLIGFIAVLWVCRRTWILRQCCNGAIDIRRPSALGACCGICRDRRPGVRRKSDRVLGVLSAIGATLRPLGAGTAGVETVFFTIVIAGRVFGPGFGFALGCTTIFTSALITGGVGPWMPYQMFGCAWVKSLRRVMQRRGRKEVLMLAAYGAISAYCFGFMLNLSFWPFAVDPHSTISYLPGAAFAVNARRYLRLQRNDITRVGHGREQ